MKKSRLAGVVVGGALGMMVAAQVAATPLTTSFIDRAGDGNLKGDVVRASLTIDNVSGDFEVRWRATSANPFSGDGDAATDDLQLNLNVGNARLMALALINTRFNVDTSTTELVVNGNNVNFIGWLDGDPVVTNSDDPLYPTKFTSGLVDLRDAGIPNRDQLASRAVMVALGDPATVPTSATFLNLLLGLTLLGLARRRRAQPLAGAPAA